MLGAGLGALAAVATGASWWALKPTSTKQMASPLRQPPATPAETTPDLTPPSRRTPTVVALPFHDLVQPTNSPFRRQLFAANESITWTHGIFFLNTETATLAGWQVRDEACTYQPHGGGRFVLAASATTLSPPSRWLFDRSTGLCWTWPGDRLDLTVSTANQLLFQRIELRLQGRPETQFTGRFIAANHQLRQLSSFELAPVPATPLPNHVLESPDLKSVVFWAVRDSGETALTLVNAYSGGTKDLWFPGQNPDRSEALYVVPGGFEANSITGPTVRSRRFGWDGTLLAETNLRDLGAFGVWSRSPTGGRLVEEELLYSDQAGGAESVRWAAVQVLDASTSALVRVRSASLRFGDALPARRWLADGSGFVAMVNGEKPPATPAWDRPGYAVIAPDGNLTQRISFPAPSGANWWQQPINRGPAPHPSRPEIVSIGRLGFLDLKTGRSAEATLATDGPAHLDPWSAGANEVVFTLGHGGHGGYAEPGLLSLKVERPPLAADLRFRVARTESCLNLRDAPTIDAAIRTCLAEGVVVALQPKTPSDPSGLSTGQRMSDGLWVRVVAPDGFAGWVNAAYLDWA